MTVVFGNEITSNLWREFSICWRDVVVPNKIVRVYFIILDSRDFYYDSEASNSVIQC